LIDGFEPRSQKADCAWGSFLLPPQLTRPVQRGASGNTPGSRVVAHTTSLIPLQQGRPKQEMMDQIRGQSSTTSGGPHFCAHPHTAQEQTSPSRVRPATPRLIVPIRGVMLVVPRGPSSTTSDGPSFIAARVGAPFGMLMPACERHHAHAACPQLKTRRPEDPGGAQVFPITLTRRQTRERRSAYDQSGRRGTLKWG